MKTTNEIPTIEEKRAGIAAFQRFLTMNRSDFRLAVWTRYEYGLSHDGFTLWNESSNAFGNNEMALISTYCNSQKLSFCVIGRKTDSPSMYGSVEIEINLCK